MKIASSIALILSSTLIAISQNNHDSNQINKKMVDSLYNLPFSYKLDNSENELSIFKVNRLSKKVVLIDIKLRNKRWGGNILTFTINNNNILTDTLVPLEKPDYSTLIKTLTDLNVFNLKSDSSFYDTIMLGNKNNYSVPFIPPDDGIDYIIKSRCNKSEQYLYSFSNPETIYNTLNEYNIDIPNLSSFIGILNAIRDKLLQNF